MTSPKGFAPWEPKKQYPPLVEQVKDVVHMPMYRRYWPATQRTWLYRMGTHYAWPKSMEYPELNRILDRGRRAGMIPWEAVAGDRGAHIEFYAHDTGRDMLQSLANYADVLCVDRQAEQAQRLILWVETKGMMPLVEDIAHDYGLDLMSGQGFDIIDRKHDFAVRISESGLPVIVLHVGDLDESGEAIWSKGLEDDIQAFLHGPDGLGGDLTIERVAVLDHHIDDYSLPWNSPKDPETDLSHHAAGFTGTRCAQAEAFEPEDLRSIVRAAIESHMNMHFYRRVLKKESRIQTRVANQVRGLLK